MIHQHLTSPRGSDFLRHWTEEVHLEPAPPRGARSGLSDDMDIHVTTICGKRYVAGSVYDPDHWSPTCTACREHDPGKGPEYVHVGRLDTGDVEPHYDDNVTVTVDLAACSVCSALVLDTPQDVDTHTAWHARTSTQG